MRIMTYNIQHCRNFVTGEIDVSGIAKVIRELKADVIGLNEVRDEGPHPHYIPMARLLGEALGMHYYFAKAIDTAGGPYGNAILSRYPMSGLEVCPIPDPPLDRCTRKPETRCVLKAHIEAGKGVDILISHFGLNEAERESAVETVLKLLEQQKGPVVLMGDFNAQPGDAVLQPLFAAMQDTAAFLPETPMTFPSDAPRIKIDYMFTRGLPAPEFAAVPQIVASDHLPYIIGIQAD